MDHLPAVVTETIPAAASPSLLMLLAALGPALAARARGR